MARILTLAFSGRSRADLPQGRALTGATVMTRAGVYWRVQGDEHRGDERHLTLWPINGHDAPLAGYVLVLPMGAREVQPGEDFMPRPVA